MHRLVTIGWTHYRDGRFGWTDTPAKSLALAEELAKKTLDYGRLNGRSLLIIERSLYGQKTTR